MLSESLDVRSQAGLDALEGCERIAGSFTLYVFDGIDVAPLRALHTIDGTLTVYGGSSPNERVLEGLQGLEQLGGLHLYGLTLPSLEPLARLRRIGSFSPDSYNVALPIGEAAGELMISGCTQLTSLAGLAALEEVAAVILLENPQLSSLVGLMRAPRVQRLVVQNCPLSTLEGVEALKVGDLAVSFTALRNLVGLGEATELSRLVLSTNTDLTSLEGVSVPAQLDELRLIRNPLTSVRGLEGLRAVGILELTDDPPGVGLVESLAGLDNLERARTLAIERQPRLSSLSGLGALVQVDDLKLGDNPSLESLAGLTSLREVSSFSLNGAPGLTSFAGVGSASIGDLNLAQFAARSLAGLESLSVSGRLSIEFAEQLLSLDGAPKLATLAALNISDAPALTDIGALASLTDIGTLTLARTGVRDLDALAGLGQLESLDLQANAQLTQVDGLAAAAGLSTLNVLDNPVLRSLPTFTNVAPPTCPACVPFVLYIRNNALLETGPTLPLLERAAYVSIAANPSLSSLSGLAALRSVEILEISDNASLVALALPNLERANQILIRGNGALDDSPLLPLLALPGARTKIASNQSGPSLLEPCPWTADNICDEELGDCAPGSDRADCGGGLSF